MTTPQHNTHSISISFKLEMLYPYATQPS